MEEFSIDQATFAVLDCVLKRRADPLYQTTYKSRFIDSIALELYTGHASKRNLP